MASWPYAIPSPIQGYGEVTLDRTLKFADITTNPFLELWVENLASLDNEEYSSYCFDVDASDPSLPFKVTLVWVDPPSVDSSPVISVNDLDLTVVHDETSRFYFGNAVGETQKTMLWDSLNNVEQVQINMHSGKYSVLVHAVDIVIGPQPYSIVATGKFKPMAQEQCTSNCKALSSRFSSNFFPSAL